MGTTRTEHDELLDDWAFAELLGIPPRMPAQWRYRHQGPRFIKLANHRVRYWRSDVEAWLDAQTINPADGNDAA